MATGFLRCPRPCATSCTAVCNVVLGRVQRAATEFYMALPVSYMDFSNVCI